MPGDPRHQESQRSSGGGHQAIEAHHRPKSVEYRHLVPKHPVQHSIHAKLPQPQAIYDPARDSTVVVLGPKIRPDVTRMPPAGISSSFVPRTGGPKKKVDPYNLDPDNACSGANTKAVVLNIATNTFKKPKRSHSKGEHLRKPLNYPIFTVPAYTIESKIKEFVDKDKRSKRFADKERDGLSEDMSREGHEHEDDQEHIPAPPVNLGDRFGGSFNQAGGPTDLPRAPVDIHENHQENNTGNNSKRELTSHYEIYQNESRSNPGSKQEVAGWNAVSGSTRRSKITPEAQNRERSDSLEGGKSNSKNASTKQTPKHDTPSFPQKAQSAGRDFTGQGHPIEGTGRSFGAQKTGDKDREVHYFEISDAALNQDEGNKSRSQHHDSVHKKNHQSSQQLGQTDSKISAGDRRSRQERELGESEDRLFQYSATNERLGPREPPISCSTSLTVPNHPS